jgi:ribonuclease HII
MAAKNSTPPATSATTPPATQHEQALYNAGYQQVAGLDEAGRGCWAGPVVAAAVVLPAPVLHQPAQLAGIADSKLLSHAQRVATYAQISALAAGVGVGVVPAYLIDAYGIVPATRLAMTIALLALPCCPDALLIDAVALHDLALPQRVLLKGEQQAVSIAAASIVAKVTRDQMLQTAERAFPGYGFAAHKGYGTQAHQLALRRLGPCLLHRRTFRPVLRYLPEEQATPPAASAPDEPAELRPHTTPAF